MSWVAVYDDSTELRQFRGDQEALFKDIEFDKLSLFVVDCGNNCVVVNIKTGDICINDQSLENNFNCDRRLIYFKRNVKSLGVGVNTSPYTEYIGWQTTIDGKNKKFMIGMDPNDDKIQYVIE